MIKIIFIIAFILMFLGAMFSLVYLMGRTKGFGECYELMKQEEERRNKRKKKA